MTKKEFENLKPFLKTLTKEQAKVIWYIEARKRGNPCITAKQKKEALMHTLLDLPKFQFRNPIKIGEKLLTDTGTEWI